MPRNWIHLNWTPTRFGTELILGQRMSTFPSPYSVPEAVQATPVADNWVRIAFRYIDGPEVVEWHEIDSALRVALGRHSGRLHQMEIDLREKVARSEHLDAEQKANILNIWEAAWQRLRESKNDLNDDSRAKVNRAYQAVQSRRGDLVDSLYP